MMQVRRATSGDAEFIAETYRPFVEDGWASFEQDVPSPDEMAARIDSAGEFYPWLIAMENERPLAYAYASPHRTRAAYVSSVDTTIYCAADTRRKGVGKQLYGALCDILTRQGYVMAFAGIALPNPASLALHKSVGFELVGTYPNVGYKHGAWRDTQWWARPLAEPANPPGPILRVSQVFS